MRDDVKNLYIPEESFLDTMYNQVEPWIQEHEVHGTFKSFDDTEISYYYLKNPDEKAAIVMVHGFCEFWPKFYELAYYFYEMGYSVFFDEHRGHGFSGRMVPELDHVSVKSYDHYVQDMKIFMDQVVVKESNTDNYILFAHSMGGCISTLFMEEYPEYFKCAVLSSPMHKMGFRGFKDWQVNTLAFVSKVLCWNNKLVPGQREFDGVNNWAKSSSISKARYDHQFGKRMETPEYTTYGGTYTWVRASLKGTAKCIKNASKIKIPVLLLEAGLDTMVDNSGHQEFIQQKPDTKLVVYPDSKHELFNATPEITLEYWSEIFDFLDQQLG